jgi:hypothetical protein
MRLQGSLIRADPTTSSAAGRLIAPEQGILLRIMPHRLLGPTSEAVQV